MSEPVDWLAYRKCRVCQRGTGNPCIARSGRIVGGRPDGVARDLAEPHTARRMRSQRRARKRYER